jgi:hypothetical protein
MVDLAFFHHGGKKKKKCERERTGVRSAHGSSFAADIGTRGRVEDHLLCLCEEHGYDDLGWLNESAQRLRCRLNREVQCTGRRSESGSSEKVCSRAPVEGAIETDDAVLCRLIENEDTWSEKDKIPKLCVYNGYGRYRCHKGAKCRFVHIDIAPARRLAFFRKARREYYIRRHEKARGREALAVRSENENMNVGRSNLAAETSSEHEGEGEPYRSGFSGENAFFVLCDDESREMDAFYEGKTVVVPECYVDRE